MGRKELLRDVGEKVGRRVSTEQESNADNSDQYRLGVERVLVSGQKMADFPYSPV